MEKYIGKSVYKGTAIGPINVLKKSDGIVKRQHVEDVAAELQRLEDAKKQAQAQLGALYEKALQEVGEVNAQIFEVHQMMLEDEDYQDAIHSMIETEELNAEYAVAVTGDNFAEIFANMDDEYMQARSADVKDISNRLIRNLSGEEELDWAHMEPSIIVADDLTFYPLLNDPLCAVFPEGHPLAAKNSVTLPELFEYPLIIETPGCDNDIQHLLTKCPVRPKISYSFRDDTLIMSFVRNGLGVTISQELVLKAFARGVVSRPLSPSCHRTLGLAFSKTANSVVSQTMLRYLQETIH